MKKLLLAGLLIAGFAQVQGIDEPTLREHLEEFHSQYAPVKEYDAWAKENLCTPLVVPYLKFENGKYWTTVFAMLSWNNTHDLDFRDRLNMTKCGYNIVNMGIQSLHNQDPQAQEALIKKYAARYEECMKFGKELRKKVEAQQEKDDNDK